LAQICLLIRIENSIKEIVFQLGHFWIKKNRINWTQFRGKNLKNIISFMEVIDNINIRKFIQENYSPYTNNSSFLKSSSEKTKLL
jgi:pyruvate-formate lyase